jgi:hypothetical protein
MPLPLWTPSAPKGQSGPFGLPDPRGSLLTCRHNGILTHRPRSLSEVEGRPMVWLAALHDRDPLRDPPLMFRFVGHWHPLGASPFSGMMNERVEEWEVGGWKSGLREV